MRYIIYGAGAVGGTIGARLLQAGKDVVLIARGEHLEKIQEQGLVLTDTGGSQTLQVDAVGHPRELDFRAGDAVLLTMKSQHTLAALEDLRVAGGGDLPVICCQNGVENERQAARRFSRVYAMVVVLPASHLEPGVVQHEAIGCGGILDAGCYPGGVEAFMGNVTEDLELAGFSARPDEKVMRWKYAKLLNNLINAIQAVTVTSDRTHVIYKLMYKEALRCLDASGVDYATQKEFSARVGKLLKLDTAMVRGGGSSWQSLTRGTGNIEADYLNGEIVLLGKLCGIATPANQSLLELANQLAASGAEPGSIPVDQVEARIEELEQAGDEG